MQPQLFQYNTAVYISKPPYNAHNHTQPKNVHECNLSQEDIDALRSGSDAAAVHKVCTVCSLYRVQRANRGFTFAGKLRVRVLQSLP